MAFDLDQMVAETKAIMAATWPETAAAGGLWEMDQVADVSFEAVGGLPYGVVDYPESEPAEWGIVNDAQEMSVAFHYVAERAVDTSTIRVALEALKTALFQASDAGSLTGWNVLYRQGIDWSGRHPATQIFLAKKAPSRAGSLTMRINFGETVL